MAANLLERERHTPSVSPGAGKPNQAVLLAATQGWFRPVLRRAAFDEKPQRAELNPAHKWLFCLEPAARVSQRAVVKGVIGRGRIQPPFISLSSPRCLGARCWQGAAPPPPGGAAATPVLLVFAGKGGVGRECPGAERR